MRSAAHRAIEAAWRIEAARVVAHAARLVRDMGVAEELAQDTLVAALQSENYPWLPSMRGDLLARLGRMADARAEFERAASMTRNLRERELLLARAAPALR